MHLRNCRYFFIFLKKDEIFTFFFLKISIFDRDAEAEDIIRFQKKNLSSVYWHQIAQNPCYYNTLLEISFFSLHPITY